MKLLSNFDTRLKEKLVDQYAEMYGADYVEAIQKSRLYYYKHVGAPLLAYLILLSVGFYVVYSYQTLPLAVEIGFRSVFGILLLILIIKVSAHYVDYKMDFLIVTPNEIIKYDQTGLFTRVTEKLHADKIKSVSIEKTGIMNSLFDIGTILFMAEGEEGQGDIDMNYVDAIEHKEKRILHILGMDKHKRD